MQFRRPIKLFVHIIVSSPSRNRTCDLLNVIFSNHFIRRNDASSIRYDIRDPLYINTQLIYKHFDYYVWYKWKGQTKETYIKNILKTSLWFKKLNYLFRSNCGFSSRFVSAESTFRIREATFIVTDNELVLLVTIVHCKSVTIELTLVILT